MTSARTVVIERLRFGVSDLERSRAFYASALAPLGIAELNGDDGAAARFGRGGAVVVELVEVQARPAPLRIALSARTRAEVEACHAGALALAPAVPTADANGAATAHTAPALLAPGEADNGGAPGPGGNPAYSATLVDPDGHELEVVCRGVAATVQVPDDRLVAVVEIPKGTRNKYEYDPILGGFTFDRLLMTAAAYPADYGYFPGTLGEDGDPLDVLVCLSEPTFPGCLIPVKPVGLFKMADDQGIDDKVICVPLHDPNWGGYDTLDELPLLLRNEIAQFFAIYKDLEGKRVDVGGWRSHTEALASIDAARARFRARREETGISYPGPGGELPAPGEE
ncbi:inorganic diphosphatase [Conexibacter stalactiti]|uniref:Inorganic pyrophosphatase n=1 Tax=Conexibacter stalactiti TaxID=1940611 RepID=A0ABU4HLR2_9ACTN|nr:inorganic diphosphatase [Conexibacter stalactiti]MDW5594241.1 inorganic diphosphatase [Conexibacter stalactiti]MEC5034883.1 inorganic diphosphatase [Conexibacter stalactiti]